MRLTSLAHGGGCGCKLAPSVLQEILRGANAGHAFPDLLVGAETCDDAAVFRVDARRAVVATTDFFMPIVDDPFDFGRIAAANALSDVYAMGGRPIMALAVLGMPIGKIEMADVRRICAGGASICERAGIPIAGGHSIDAPEPIYGLAAIGLVDPDRTLTNGGARPGDVLILTKPLGVGIYSAALRRELLSPADYDELICGTTRLNDAGVRLAAADGVHAATDVTGFGLLGHLLEMCRASNLQAEIGYDRLPFFARAEALAADAVRTGACDRNWSSYGEHVQLPAHLEAWRRDLLTDPQTSGGLLIAVRPDCAEGALSLVQSEGLSQASIIGRLAAGRPGVRVTL